MYPWQYPPLLWQGVQARPATQTRPKSSSSSKKIIKSLQKCITVPTVGGNSIKTCCSFLPSLWWWLRAKKTMNPKQGKAGLEYLNKDLLEKRNFSAFTFGHFYVGRCRVFELWLGRPQGCQLLRQSSQTSIVDSCPT